MTVNRRLFNVIQNLFERNWETELSDEEDETLCNQASTLIVEYGWTEVYATTFEYLTENCTTPESVVNFAHIYFEFGWHEMVIPSPHQFLGYLYFRVDSNPVKYDADVIFDTLATSILPLCGFIEANPVNNPYYSPDLDPKIIAETEEWKKSKVK